MKRIILFILLLSPLLAFSQNPVQVTQPQWFLKYIKEGPYTTATLPVASTCTGCLVYNSDIHNYEYCNGTVWNAFSGTGSSAVDSIYQHADSLFYSTTDTSYYVGKWLTFADTLNGIATTVALNDSLSAYVKLQTQPPTASISTTPTIYEFTSNSTQQVILQWTAGRLGATSSANATAPLSTITVNGTQQTFTQPSAPGTVNGNDTVTAATNANHTYSTVVTTTDSKTATASTGISYESKEYVGYVSSATPSDAAILAATGGTVGGVFATVRQSGPTTLASPGSSLYTVIAYPASMGLATIKIGGFVTVFNLTVRSLVNASGYSVSYNVYTSPFPSAGAINYQIL